MKRFFNIIGTEGNCRICLYGEIGGFDQVDVGQVARELLEAEAQYKKIDVYINSYGGDVFGGITIFNELRASKADITIYVVGVAASIASVVATCGKPVYAAPNAHLMIHGVSGGCYGSKEEIKTYLEQLEKLEGTLCEMYAAKMKITPEQVRARFFDDGEDHWLTAQEAVELGLIDGIIQLDTDTEPIPDASTPEKVYEHYQNKYLQSLKTDNMLNKLKTRPSFANCADEQAVLNRIEELEADAAKVPVLQAEADKVPTLEQEKTNLQTRVTEYESQAQAAAEAALDAEVETAFQEGRITDPERTGFKALMRTDADNTRTILQARPAKRRAITNLAKPDEAENMSPWDRRMAEIEENLKNKK